MDIDAELLQAPVDPLTAEERQRLSEWWEQACDFEEDEPSWLANLLLLDAAFSTAQQQYARQQRQSPATEAAATAQQQQPQQQRRHLLRVGNGRVVDLDLLD